ncbi:sigma cross-reacting protein 27A [Vibrio astriarenae]|nr:sigma cross-reacting protein 27A [Vibrio sp. C7]
MPNVAIILSGCGVYDGTEINEAVLTLLELERNGISYQTFAPDMLQAHTINHAKGEATQETRNVLVESNRITRSETSALEDLDASEFDALVFVGGFGAAKNLSNFAFDQPHYSAIPQVSEVIRSFHSQNKWIVALCIAPVLLASTLPNIKVTIGNDQEIARLLESKGHTHVDCKTDSFVVDVTNQLITTPAYMTGQSIKEVHEGIQATIQHLGTKIS